MMKEGGNVSRKELALMDEENAKLQSEIKNLEDMIRVGRAERS